MEDSYSLTTVDVVAYAALFGFTIKMLTVENKDVTCPYLKAPKEECAIRGGMPFADTHPTPDDTPEQLRKKVSKAMRHETSAIKWRRSLVLAVFINAGLAVLLWRKPMPWWKFYLGVIVTYFIIFGYFNYYSYHISREAEQRGRASLKQLYEKLNHKPEYSPLA